MILFNSNPSVKNFTVLAKVDTAFLFLSTYVTVCFSNQIKVY